MLNVTETISFIFPQFATNSSGNHNAHGRGPRERRGPDSGGASADAVEDGVGGGGYADLARVS